MALRYCKVRKYQRTETLTYENKTATTFDEKATMLKEVLFPKTKAQPRYNEIQEQRQTITFHTVTDNEIRGAIFTSNVKKAAGPDNINFLCLQNVYNAKQTAFHILYKCLTSVAYQPQY